MKKLFVILTAIALVGAFTATAMAADWGFYGSSRMSTFYTSVEYNDAVPATGVDDSDLDLRWAQQGNSRIGANVNVSDKLKGRFEYGTGVNLRILWAEYDFGGWKLGLGQHYTPVHAWVSGQVYGDDANMLDVGGIYGSRKDMIRFTAVGGALKIALIETNVGSTGSSVDTDVILPKIEARFDLPLGDTGRLGFLGGFNSYNIQDISGDDEETVSSYILGVLGNHSFGAMYFNWNAYYAINYGEYGLGNEWVAAAPQSYANINADLSVDDSSTIGALAVFGMGFSDSMGMELGVGYRVDDNEDLDPAIEDPDDILSMYFQLPITVAAGFSIIPEVGYYMGMEDGYGNDDPDVAYLGAKWMMNF